MRRLPRRPAQRTPLIELAADEVTLALARAPAILLLLRHGVGR